MTGGAFRNSSNRVSYTHLDVYKRQALKDVDFHECDTNVLDIGVAAYLLNPMEDSYDYDDVAKEYPVSYTHLDVYKRQVPQALIRWSSLLDR